MTSLASPRLFKRKWSNLTNEFKQALKRKSLTAPL
jgi:hypothetical protein